MVLDNALALGSRVTAAFGQSYATSEEWASLLASRYGAESVSGSAGGSTAASSTLASFSSKVGQATDGVLGGFVKADGTVDFVPFTRNGLTGHTAAQAAGAIPADAAGGFSVTVQDGKIVGYNFQSALNANSPNYRLPPALQQQIKTALSAATTGH